MGWGDGGKVGEPRKEGETAKQPSQPGGERTRKKHGTSVPADTGRNMKGSEGKVVLLCLTFCDPMDYTAHGILQARIPEWVPFSRGSS